MGRFDGHHIQRRHVQVLSSTGQRTWNNSLIGWRDQEEGFVNLGRNIILNLTTPYALDTRSQERYQARLWVLQHVSILSPQRCRSACFWELIPHVSFLCFKPKRVAFRLVSLGKGQRILAVEQGLFVVRARGKALQY